MNYLKSSLVHPFRNRPQRSFALPNRRDIFAAIAFTALVTSLGALNSYVQSKYWPGMRGLGSWSAATDLTLLAFVASNLFAIVIVGAVAVYNRTLHREWRPIFGIYVTVVNVTIAFLLWLVPQIV